jgi:hypothetical protein
MNRRGATHAIGIESWELTLSVKGQSDVALHEFTNHALAQEFFRAVLES